MEDANDDVVFDELDCIRVQESHVVKKAPASVVANAVAVADAQTTVEVEQSGLEETIVGKGIGNALKVFRERGLLGRDQIKGRTKDKTMA